MKNGKTLVELATEISLQKSQSKDFIVPTQKMTMQENGTISFANGETHDFKPTSWAAGQIATYADIPKGYFDRLNAENPALLSRNVNHGLEKASKIKENEGRMLRTVNGTLRAFVSPSYRRLDSYDMLNEILPVLQKNELQIMSSELTEKRLYLKALMPKLQADIKIGDAVQYGLVISNSEVGAGALTIEPLIYRLVCSNGLITSTSVRKNHLGRSQAERETYELFSDRTKNLTDAAFWAQIKDVLMASMNPDFFEKEVNRLREASLRKITNFDLNEVVELTMKTVNQKNDALKNDLVAYLANGADGAGLTQWGLANAFTYAAQSEKIDYDSSIELERTGSLVLNLTNKDWERIAVKAA